MNVKLRSWVSKSSDPLWCESGLDLINLNDKQKAIQKLASELITLKKSNPPADLKIFILSN